MTDPATLIYSDDGLVCEPTRPHMHHSIHHSHIRFFTPIHPNLRHHHGYVHQCHVAHHAHCWWDLGGPSGGGAGDAGGFAVGDSMGGGFGFDGDAGVASGFGGGFAGGGDSGAGSFAFAFADAGAFAKAVAFAGPSPGYSPHLYGAAAPELSSLPMLLLGLGAIAYKFWRRRAA